MNKKIKLNFHDATPSDIQRIAEIEIENHLSNFNDHPLDRLMNNLFLNEYKKRWEKKLRDGMHTLIVSVRHLSVGFITYTICKQEAEIHNIYIIADMRRHQLGKTLCLQALKKMRSESVTRVSTWLVEGRNKITQFYQAMGFKMTDAIRQDSINEQYILNERQYELRLPHES